MLFLLFFLFLCAFCTYTLVVELFLLYNVSVDVKFGGQLWCLFVHQVDNLSTFFAEKVYMPLDVTIVAYAVVVYRNHLCRMHFAQHSERVVNCGAAQRGHLFV